MENTEKVSLVLNKLQQQADELHLYLNAWFSQLPLEGMEEIMEYYYAPEREDYTATQEGEDEYQYELAEYIDSLYRDFSDGNLSIKLNDFKRFAGKYSDLMAPSWDFIAYARIRKII